MNIFNDPWASLHDAQGFSRLHTAVLQILDGIIYILKEYMNSNQISN